MCEKCSSRGRSAAPFSRRRLKPRSKETGRVFGRRRGGFARDASRRCGGRRSLALSRDSLRGEGRYEGLERDMARLESFVVAAELPATPREPGQPGQPGRKRHQGQRTPKITISAIVFPPRAPR